MEWREPREMSYLKTRKARKLQNNFSEQLFLLSKRKGNPETHHQLKNEPKTTQPSTNKEKPNAQKRVFKKPNSIHCYNPKQRA